YMPATRGALAHALGAVGRVDESLVEVAVALDQIEREGWEEHFHHVDILVTKGSLLQLKGDFTGAEASYREALDIARHQQAKSWELRAMTSLARLWQDQGKSKEAYDLLAPVYNWFTEGFDTKDLKDAKAVLDEVS